MQNKKSVFAKILTTCLLLTSVMAFSAYAKTPEPISVDVPITNIVTGIESTNEDFTFSLKGENTDLRTTINGNGSGTFTLSGLTFGDYTYNVTQDTDNSDFNLDRTLYRVVVSVYNNEDMAGYFSTILIYKEDGTKVSEITYTNAYKGIEPGVFDPPITKRVIVKNGSASINTTDTFSFILSPVDGAPMPIPSKENNTVLASDGVSLIVSHVGEGAAEFGNITCNTEGTYKYTVKELTGDNHYYTYDSNVFNLTIDFKKDSNKITPKASYTRASDGVAFDSIVFTNEYYRKGSSSSSTSSGGGSGTISGGTSDTEHGPGITKTEPLKPVSTVAPDPTYGLNPDGTSMGNIILNSIPKTGEEAMNMIAILAAISGILCVCFILLGRVRRKA